MSVALVTGAGRGLGLETCRQLGQRGFRVILTARNEREGQAKAERLATEGIDVEYRPLDVSSPSSISALAKRAHRGRRQARRAGQQCRDSARRLRLRGGAEND